MDAHLDPARFAQAQRQLFTGRRLRVGTGRAVHAVDWSPWADGHQLPIPACRTGWVGHGTGGDLRPTRDAVSCRRCLALQPGEHQTVDETQLGLW